MPTGFHKAIEQEISDLPNTYVFLDHILIFTKGLLEEHYVATKKVLDRLKQAKVWLRYERSKFAEIETEWLGNKLTQTGITPINSNVQAIPKKLKPKKIKDLRSYLGAVNQMNRFISNSAQLCHDLRPCLQNDKKWQWEDKDNKAFEQINRKVEELTEVGDFRWSQPFPIMWR